MTYTRFGEWIYPDEASAKAAADELGYVFNGFLTLPHRAALTDEGWVVQEPCDTPGPCPCSNPCPAIRRAAYVAPGWKEISADDEGIGFGFLD